METAKQTNKQTENNKTMVNCNEKQYTNSVKISGHIFFINVEKVFDCETNDFDFDFEVLKWNNLYGIFDKMKFKYVDIFESTSIETYYNEIVKQLKLYYV